MGRVAEHGPGSKKGKRAKAPHRSPSEGALRGAYSVSCVTEGSVPFLTSTLSTLRKCTYTYRFPNTLPLFRNVRPPPNRRGRRPRRPLGCHIIWRYMGGEALLTRCRGGCPHPPSRREARNIGEDGWLVQPTFSQTAAQGRAGTPAPTTRLGRVRNICRRAYTYRHTRYDARWSV